MFGVDWAHSKRDEAKWYIWLVGYNETTDPYCISAWLIRDAISALKIQELPLSFFQNCAYMLLKLFGNPFPVSTRQSPRHRYAVKLQFSVSESSAAKQLCIGPLEIPVEGWIKDGVKGGVKIAQPQHHRVECIGWVSFCFDAHPGEEGEVGEPTDDKSP